MNLGPMRLIDRQFLETPFYGVRQMSWNLQNEGHPVNQKRIPAADATHALDADLPEAQHQQARQARGTRPTPYLLGWPASGSPRESLVR